MVVQMVKRVILPFFFVMLIIALVLSLGGVNRIGFNQGYMNYLKSVANKFNNLSDLEIPQIPTFNTTFDGAWYSILIDVVKFIANLFVGICNLAITVTNFVNKLFLFAYACISAVFEISNYVVA